MGLGVALAVVIMPFSSTSASLVGVTVALIVVGVWFAILAGVWYGRREENLLWALIAGVLGWLMLGAGIYAISPNVAFPFTTVICILMFFISYKYMELNQDSFIPIPHLIREDEIPDYQQQYPYSHDPGRIRQKPRDLDQTSKPRYWGSWKGKVILAIAEARTQLALNEIIAGTDLHSSAVTIAIKELQETGDITYEINQTYLVEPELYHEYRAYIKMNQRKTPGYSQPASKPQATVSHKHSGYSQPASKPQATVSHKHRTNNGEMVRSKSEVIVANTLAHLGINYEYEKRLENPHESSDSIHPDFTIHHNGKVLYWEHLGMLQRSSYKANWERKRSWYYKCGFGDSLIISRDGEDGSIDAQTIEAIVRSRILQSS
jgi:hypothetical protein